MAATESASQLVVPPTCSRYRQGQPEGLAQLQQVLQAQEATRPIPITRLQDVLLSSDGLLQGRYRFTSVGLRSFCFTLSPGLSALAANIAGVRQRVNGPEEPCSVASAVRLINEVTRLRFHANLQGCSLVVDPRSRTVEGLVGPRYEFFSNLRLLELSMQFITATGRSMRFMSATLAGRHLLLRYIEPATRFQLHTGGDRDRFCRGWSFSNSETGESALKVNGLLIRVGGSASSWDVGRCVHIRLTQRKLDRLQQRFRDATELPFGDFWEPRLQLLRSTSLQLGASQERNNRIKTILGKLSRTVGRRIGQRAVQRALGSLDDAIVNSPEARRRLSRISCYDLYNSLTSVAQTLTPAEQDQAESLAHRILTGHLRF